jgi:hypothetical protein
VSRDSGSKLDRIFSPVLAIGFSQPSSPCFSPRFFGMFALYASRCFYHDRNRFEAATSYYGPSRSHDESARSEPGWLRLCRLLWRRKQIVRSAQGCFNDSSSSMPSRCSQGVGARGCARGAHRRRTRTSLIPRDLVLSRPCSQICLTSWRLIVDFLLPRLVSARRPFAPLPAFQICSSAVPAVARRIREMANTRGSRTRLNRWPLLCL